MDHINCSSNENVMPVTERKPSPEEILLDVMEKMKVEFDSAVKSGNYTGVFQASDELIKISKAITELRSGNVVKDVLDRLGSLDSLLEK